MVYDYYEEDNFQVDGDFSYGTGFGLNPYEAV